MRRELEDISAWIELFENVIFDGENCPSPFENTFCGGNELINVTFSSKKMHVFFVVSSGQTVTDSFPIEEFDKWLDNDSEDSNDHI